MWILDPLMWQGGDSDPCIFPHLRWTSPDHIEHIAIQQDRYIYHLSYAWSYISSTTLADPEGFLPLLEEFDFRYMPLNQAHATYHFLDFMHWLFESQQVMSSVFNARVFPPNAHSSHIRETVFCNPFYARNPQMSLTKHYSPASGVTYPPTR